MLIVIIIAFVLKKLRQNRDGYYEEDEEESKDTRREVLPGLKMRTFDRTTLCCLFLSILFMVIFTVSGNNLKIMIENDLSVLTDKSRTVFLFSMMLLVSRVVKIISNLLLYHRFPCREWYSHL